MKALSVMVMGGVAALSLILSGCGSGTSGNEAIVMAQSSFSGAIFTTNSVGNVNINIFSTKEDVYLNGGPAHPGAAGLPDGAYYGQVTAPNGDVLGRTDGPAITVTGGVFASNYKLWDILFYTDTSGAFILDGIGDKIPGFEDSPNNVYKAWVSSNPAFPNPASKTDNFKVNVQIVGGPPPAGTLQVNKFYDANANGINDDSQPITGWLINITDGITYDRYTPVSIVLDPDDYIVSEYQPIETNWVPTTPTSVAITLNDGDSQTVEFGNLSLGAGGGKTLGFWSNKNGQAMVDSADLAMLAALNLRKADGSHFDPTTYAQLKNWLQGAKATNMAYMLSAQLAAMELNVYNGLVDGSALIFAPDATSANGLGFATVNAVMAEADAELGIHGTATVADSWRAYQEALKNALDKANNNLTFVLPTPGPFTF
jgi:hypothetical protein